MTLEQLKKKPSKEGRKGERENQKTWTNRKQITQS